MPLRGIGYIGRRVRQSFTHFEHGPRLVWDMFGSRKPEMVMRTRSGITMHVPNVPGARFPVYEINADDVYRLDELLDGLRPDLVGLDVGGHIGSFSTAVCHRVPGATMHAYEASPSTAVWLECNATANGFQDRLAVHQEAVSDHEGTLDFVDNGEASAHNGLTAPDGLGSVVTVPCVTLDQAFAAAGGRVELIKSDAEGAEYGFILSSDPALWSSVQRVVMEYHPVAGHSLADLVAYFEAVGISLVRDEPSPDTPGLGNAWFARAR